MRIWRIVFSGGVLHPQGDEEGRWLLRLLGPQASDAARLPVERVGADEGFDTGRAYGLWGAERSWPGWAAIADAGVAPSGVLTLFEAAYDGAVVVGFGMTEVAKRVLSRIGVPFLDFAIHPVRFLEDLFFAVQTNDPGVFAAMLSHHADASRFRAAAGLVAASLGQAPLAMPSSTLLVGQRARDPALLRNGAFADFASFPDAVRAASGPGGAIAFHPHPAEATDFGLLAAGMPFAAVRPMRGDPHALLASGMVARVVGLSSPLLTAARHFGVEAERLLSDPFDLPDRAADAVPGQHLSIVDGAFETDFWRDALAPLVAVTAPDGLRWRRPPNSLRTALRRIRPWVTTPRPWAETSGAFRDDPVQA